MAQQYSSFMVRCWRFDDDRRRIKVEHIQSGQDTQLATLDAALAWIDGQWREQPLAPDAAEDEPEAARILPTADRAAPPDAVDG